MRTEKIYQSPIPAREENFVHGLDPLSKLLGCSKPTLIKLIREGRIPFMRIGYRYLFDKSQVFHALGSDSK